MVDSIICEVSSWVLVKKEFKGWNLNDMIRDWCRVYRVPHIAPPLVLDWIPPLGGQVTINFDGASFGNLGPVGYGCLMRDSQGSIILVKGGPLGRCDVNHAELIGMLEGLKMLKSKGFFNCSVEGDSKTIISWGRGDSEGFWRLRHYIYEIQALSLHLKAKLLHIPRSRNSLADWVVGLYFGSLWSV